MIFKLQVKKPPFYFSWNFPAILYMVQMITLYFIINILKAFLMQQIQITFMHTSQLQFHCMRFHDRKSVEKKGMFIRFS